jgi:hypothetical protein
LILVFSCQDDVPFSLPCTYTARGPALLSQLSSLCITSLWHLSIRPFQSVGIVISKLHPMPISPVSSHLTFRLISKPLSCYHSRYPSRTIMFLLNPPPSLCFSLYMLLPQFLILLFPSSVLFSFFRLLFFIKVIPCKKLLLHIYMGLSFFFEGSVEHSVILYMDFLVGALC